MDRLPELSAFKSTLEKERSDVAAFLLNTYGLSCKPESLEKAEHTSSSDVYRGVADSVGPIVLKSSSWFRPPAGEGMERVQESLETAYAMSEALREKDVPVQRVNPDLKGERVALWNGYPTTLLEWMDGQGFEFTKESFKTAGSALGLFHKKGTEVIQEGGIDKHRLDRMLVELPYEESRELYLRRMKQDILEAPAESSGMIEAFRENIDFLESVMSDIDASGISSEDRARGFLHNDFNAGNMLLNADGSLKGILDIDQAGTGAFAWDIGNTLASFATQMRKEHPDESFEEYAREFLRAYHAENPLPTEEYLLALAGTQRWDMMRILRNIRRHLYEGGRISGNYGKTMPRLIPRLKWAPETFSFLTKEWIEETL